MLKFLCSDFERVSPNEQLFAREATWASRIRQMILMWVSLVRLISFGADCSRADFAIAVYGFMLVLVCCCCCLSSFFAITCFLYGHEAASVLWLLLGAPQFRHCFWVLLHSVCVWPSAAHSEHLFAVDLQSFVACCSMA